MLSEVCRNCVRSSQPSLLFARGEMVGPDCCESLDCGVFHERCRLVTRIEDCKIAVTEIEEVHSV